MSYDSRVNEAIKNPTEEKLIHLIQENISTQDSHIKAKETAISALAQFYVDQRTP